VTLLGFFGLPRSNRPGELCPLCSPRYALARLRPHRSDALAAIYPSFVFFVVFVPRQLVFAVESRNAFALTREMEPTQESHVCFVSHRTTAALSSIRALTSCCKRALIKTQSMPTARLRFTSALKTKNWRRRGPYFVISKDGRILLVYCISCLWDWGVNPHNNLATLINHVS